MPKETNTTGVAFLEPATGRMRPAKGYARVLERFASTPLGAWFFVKVAPHVDRRLVRLSGGRVSTALIRPVALLTSTGARSGRRRTTPLLFFLDGEDVVLIASYGGNPRHPAWYHNLKANPDVEVWARGRSGRYRSREAEGTERDRLWALAADYYAGYETYQRRTGGRRIPVLALEPVRV